MESHLVMHVIDISDPERELHMNEVDKTLDDLDAGDIPKLMVLNKVDALSDDDKSSFLCPSGWIMCSAATGEGLEALLIEVERRLFQQKQLKGQS